MNAPLGSKEHDDMMAQFERTYRHMRLARERREYHARGSLYESGETNALFIAYRHGYTFGRALSGAPEEGTPTTVPGEGHTT